MIVINGASGWLGKSTIRALVEQNPNLSKNDFLFIGSASRKIIDPTLGEIEVNSNPGGSFLESPCELFVQLAFKTKDYIRILGPKEYLLQNKIIVEKSLEIARILKPKNLVLVSSGVVSKFIESGQYDDEYTQTKILEEESFNNLSTELNANISIGRLWGSSGELMSEPLKYAIGDVINQAFYKSSIDISAGNDVYRRYVDSVEFMKLVIESCIRNRAKLVESGGYIIEIEQLAKMILETFGIKKPILRRRSNDQIPDLYFSTSTLYEELSLEFGLPISDMTAQIKKTFNSIRR